MKSNIDEYIENRIKQLKFQGNLYKKLASKFPIGDPNKKNNLNQSLHYFARIRELEYFQDNLKNLIR